MPEYTPLKKLYKPNRRDILEVDTTLSENFAIIDNEFGKVENEIKKTNTTINQLVIEGDSSVEAAQARLSGDGQVYDTLKERLDTEHQSTASKLAEKAQQEDLEIERARISNLTANAGNTDGNAELLDIRVGFDGVTYATAGEATRAIGNYMTEENQTWEVV